jgi:hypothetical protein
MRYKFDEIKELLFDKVVDCLIVSETKIGLVNKLFGIDGGLYNAKINHFTLSNVTS